MTIIVTPTTATYGGTIEDYATLQGALVNWLHRDDLDSEIQGFIQLGENRIYRDLRVRQMETTFSSVIASGSIAVPTGYVEMKYAYVNGSPMVKMQRKDAEWIYANYPTRSADGTPKFFAREAETLIFGPYPDSAYTVKGVYYKRLTSLSDANPTNWLTSDVPDLILYASMCEAAQWLQEDDRVILWEKKYDQILQRVKRNDIDEEFSGSPLAATVR
jgi:hypothetical protein